MEKYEDGLILSSFLGIFVGMMMTLFGIFVPHESFLYWDYWLAIGLPLWIASTVYISRGLHILSDQDIRDAFSYDR